MKKKIIIAGGMFFLVVVLIFAGVFVFAQPEPEKSLKLKMLYNYNPILSKGGLELKESFVKLGEYAEPFGEPNYNVIYYNFDGEEIANVPYRFGLTNEPFYNLNLFFYIPYHANAKTISIKSLGDNGGSYYYVGYLADVCGDGECQEHESYADCPDDCSQSGKDDYCNEADDGICDSDCVALGGKDADEAFMFDTGDCGADLLPDGYTCGDGTLYCVQDTRVTCFYDINMIEHWFVHDSCLRGTCVDGKCKGEFDIISNVGCVKNEDCRVDGLEEWECDCFGNCHPPGTFEEICCDERMYDG